MASSLSPDIGGESSQVLAELSAIFPAIDYSVLVSVLQAHSQQLEAAVEYLLGVSGPRGDPASHGVCPDSTLTESMAGQFSEDIGGLPEVLPAFLDDSYQGDSDSEDEEISLSRSLSPDSNVDSADDPLPTYEDACTDADRLPVAVYIPDLPGPVAEVPANNVSDPAERRANDEVKGESIKKKSKKKIKHKKPGKVNLGPSRSVKVKISKGKGSSVLNLSARPGYAQLVDGAQNNFYLEEEDDDDILLHNS